MRAVDGEYREIRYRGVEILRRVAAAIRDTAWATMPWSHEVVGTRASAAPDTASDTVPRAGEHFAWSLTSAADACPMIATLRADIGERELSFRFEATAVGSFSASRLGVYVLQPLSMAGTTVEVIRTDGETHHCIYPHTIAPRPIFTSCVGLRFQIEGIDIRMSMEGAVLEAEDQRNWIDDSFKIYCPPLGDPYPVAYPAGTTVAQTLRISLQAVETSSAVPRQTAPSRSLAHRSAPTTVTATIPATTATDHSRPELPSRCSLGVWLASPRGDDVPGQLAWLRSVRPSFVRIDSGPRLSDQRTAAGLLDSAATDGIPVELAWYAEPDEGVADLLNIAERYRDVVRRVLLISDAQRTTAPALSARVREGLAERSLEIAVGTGTDWYYAEINRAGEALPEGDFLHFSITPQMHDTDDEAVMGSLSALPTVLTQASDKTRTGPLVISPLTFRRRTRLGRPTTVTEWAGNGLDVAHAPAWTLATCAILTQARVAAATLFSLQSIRDLETGTSPLLAAFLREILTVSAAPGVVPLSFDHSGIYGVSWQDGVNTTAWIANRCRADAEVRVGGRPEITMDLGGYEIKRATIQDNDQEYTHAISVS